MDEVARPKLLTIARKRFVSSLAKNLLLVVVAAAFGGDIIFKLTGRSRLIFVLSIGTVALSLFVIGFWLAVEGEPEG